MPKHSIHQSAAERLASTSEGTVAAIRENIAKTKETTEAVNSLTKATKDKSVEVDGFLAVTKAQKATARKVEEVKSAALVSNKLLKDIRDSSPKLTLDGISVMTLKGDKGDKGEKGDRGEKGDSIRGEQGIPGKDGVDGTTGPKGADGKSGNDGRDGKDGTDGKDGRDGKDGSPDSPDEVVEKVNEAKKLINPVKVRGLSDLFVQVEKYGSNPSGAAGGGPTYRFLQDGTRISDLVTELNLSTGLTGTYAGDGRITITSAGSTSPLTTKGDVYGYSTTNARVPVGANGTVLTADSTEALGVKWSTNGTGDVSKVGTPVNNQVGVWTGDGTLEGDAALTFDTATDTLATTLITATTVTANLVGNVTGNVSGSSGSTTGNAATVTTNANLTGPVTSVGNATAIADAALSIAKTSGLQAALDLKAPLTSPTFATSVTGSYLTASEMLIIDASKNIISAPVATYPSLTELTYVKGATSAIQTQLNGKQATITFGTGVQTALGVNVGSAGAPVLFNGALGTPSSGTLTNATGLPIAGLVSSTTQALGVGSIELGHATDTTITRVSAGVAAIEGANIIVSGGALGTPASGTLTNATGLPVAGITSSTSTALGVGTLELGHASDTTLSRSAAGVLAVEGVVVPTVSSTSTLTNKTIQHTVEPSVDDTFTGEQITGFNATATIAQWDAVYLSTTGWALTDADAAATAGGVMIGLAAAAGTNTNPLTVVTRGVVRNDGWTWATVGAPIYLGLTPGELTLTAPSATDDVVRIVGYVMSDDCIYFSPSNDWLTRV